MENFSRNIEKGLVHYHSYMMRSIDENFETIKEGLILRYQEKAEKLFNKIKL